MPDTEEEGDEIIVEPLPGIVLWLTWPGGSDRAVTGLWPDIDPGYADFQLQPDLPYSLSVEEPNAPILSQLVVPTCLGKDEQEPQHGTWKIVIELTPR
jgi:hypothetical protein